MTFQKLGLMLALATLCSHAFCQQSETSISFSTTNKSIQWVYDQSVERHKHNILDFGKYKVLVEGGHYRDIWLETAPLTGPVIARWNVRAAKDAQLAFMDTQRSDGRLAGAVGLRGDKAAPRYNVLQGNYLPLEALDVYYWIGKDKNYLQQLYTVLRKYDEYLWRHRDTDGNGCLESWCIGDTGEDNTRRYGQTLHYYMFDYPPTKENVLKMSKNDSVLLMTWNKTFVKNNAKWIFKNDSLNPSINHYLPWSYNVRDYLNVVPVESMDMMAYSYANRFVLAEISSILNNGEEKNWLQKAAAIKNKIREYLWRPELNACYDRDKNENFINVLLHNNLRCMYFGAFDQQMADAFIKNHLMNEAEFWTPFPLPSIATNDSLFRQTSSQDWSGTPHLLSYQRAIRALENYGHYAELTLLANRYLETVFNAMKFTMGYNCFTKQPDGTEDGYGPGYLLAIEFISRLYGVTLSKEQVYWTCLEGNDDFKYIQKIGSRNYELTSNKNEVVCSLNNKSLFSFSGGVRVVTDLNGKLLEVIGVAPVNVNCKLKLGGKIYNLIVKPNEIYEFSDNNFTLEHQTDFIKSFKL